MCKSKPKQTTTAQTVPVRQQVVVTQPVTTTTNVQPVVTSSSRLPKSVLHFTSDNQTIQNPNFNNMIHTKRVGFNA